MKYIMDADALKECLDLLPQLFSNPDYVCLSDVKKMIDRFPKEQYGVEYMDTLKKLVVLNEKNENNQDILFGK